MYTAYSHSKNYTVYFCKSTTMKFVIVTMFCAFFKFAYSEGMYSSLPLLLLSIKKYFW